MQIFVESCYTSRRAEMFRLTLPNGAREYVTTPEGEGWTRKTASKALDLLERFYNVSRRNVRFRVR